MEEFEINESNNIAEIPPDDNDDDGDEDALDPETQRDLSSAQTLSQICDAALFQTCDSKESSSTDSVAGRDSSKCRDCDCFELCDGDRGCRLVPYANTITEVQLAASRRNETRAPCVSSVPADEVNRNSVLDGEARVSQAPKAAIAVPLTGRLPQFIVNILNEEWNSAGSSTPNDVKLHEIASRFGLADARRFRKFFKDKKGRIERSRRRQERRGGELDFGDSLVQRVEGRIFNGSSDGHGPSLVTEALYYVSHLERISTITDVGVKVVHALNTKSGEYAILRFLRAFWGTVRLHFLDPNFKGSSESAAKARFEASSRLEISMRLHFFPAYAFSLFGGLCVAIAKEEGEPAVHKRICLSVSKRLMKVIFSRLRDALMLEN